MTLLPEEMSGTDKMKARIEYLEKTARWNIFAMNVLVSLGELQHNASLARDPERVLDIIEENLEKLIEFNTTAFFMVDEGSSDFVLNRISNEENRALFQEVVDEQIEHGTFAWALNQNRPVLVNTKLHTNTIILHVLATKSRVRGMFVGSTSQKQKEINGQILYLLSIMMQSTANSLESAALYDLIYQQNANLEKLVQRRTEALEKQTDELKEEIAFRKLADESLTIAKIEAESAARAKSEFLTNMSHEIRTPLNAILGYGEILQYEARKSNLPGFVKDLQAIESSGKHLLCLINDVLDLSKIQAGKMEMNLQEFSVSKMVDDVVATCLPLVKKNGNRFETIYGEGGIDVVHSDEARVRQILLNLIGNAAKFTKEGSITLNILPSTIGGEDHIVFEVKDTGIGIDSEKLADLFDEFTQADSSTTRKYGGTGLGLAISQRLCGLLGGNISVTSQLGEGSIFSMTIPTDLGQRMRRIDEAFTERSMANLQGTGTSFVPATSDSSSGSEKKDYRDVVLVIDDDQIVCDLIPRYLEKEGFRVEVATNGVDGLKLAKALRPDVITLDVMMPDMDGWEVLAKLKEDAVLAKIPVVMLTMADAQEKALRLGADDYIPKPLDWDRLISVVKQFQKISNKGSILIIEDDLANRGALSRILSQEGWDISITGSGTEALCFLGEQLPGLILLDLILPEMDGFEFIANMKSMGIFGKVPIMVLSAKDLEKEEKTKLGQDVQKFLQKGRYSRSELINEIRALIGKPSGK